MITSYKNWGIQGNSVKSTNNPMSSFGLIEENMELSHTDEAVLKGQCQESSDFFDFSIIISCKNWGNQGNSAKSTNNLMPSFGLIEENMELSHTD